MSINFQVLGVGLSIALVTGPLRAAESRLVPLDHFRGQRLQESKAQALQGAQAAANAGAGYEAALILLALAENTDGEDALKQQAATLLEQWGLADTDWDRADRGAINRQVRERLQLEFQAQADIRQAETLLAFGDFAAAAELVTGVLSRPLFGEGRKQVEQFQRRHGLPALADLANTVSPAAMAEQLQDGVALLRYLDSADFLVHADPAAGRMMKALIDRQYPNAQAVREARAQNNGNARFRRGFGGGGFPGFPGGFPGFRGRFGTEQAVREPEAEPVVDLTIDGVIESLDFLAKDDTEQAIGLLKLALAVFKDAPDVGKLETTLKQAELYQLTTELESTVPKSAATDRFQEPRKPGKAEAIFSGKLVPHYEIEVAERFMEALRADPKSYVPATFRSGDKILQNVGFRLKGGIGSFRPLADGNKIGVTIKLNQFEKGQKFLGLKKIVLNNGVQDQTFLRERLGYDIYRSAGLPAPRAGHAKLTLNGKDYGLYVQVESMTSDGLKRWFQDGGGDAYEGSIGTDITAWEEIDVDSDEETVDRSKLAKLVGAAEQALEERSLAPLEAYLDLPAFARFLALEVLMDHWDGYLAANNYRVYLDPKTEKFYFLPHGADQLFRNSGGDLYRRGRGILTEVFMGVEQGRALFINEVDILMATVLEPNAVRERLRPTYERIRSYVGADPFYSGTIADFDAQVSATVTYFDKKARLVRWQKLAASDPALSQRLENLNPGSRRGFWGFGGDRGGRGGRGGR